MRNGNDIQINVLRDQVKKLKDKENEFELFKYTMKNAKFGSEITLCVDGENITFRKMMTNQPNKGIYYDAYKLWGYEEQVFDVIIGVDQGQRRLNNLRPYLLEMLC